MGRVTVGERPASCRARYTALQCTVQLQLHAVTCPGVLLPSHEDVYVSVRMMGQYHKTKCVPSAFPLLLHEKMVFTKIFSGAVDPGDIADHLENDTTCFELIQLVPPEGEILATLQENTRDFLYPGPRLTPPAPGSEREVLMKKSVSFPGISPKVEFSTTSIIEECDVKASQSTFSPSNPSPTKPCCVSKSPAGRGRTKPSTAPLCGYQQPTVASQSRSPSPYTHRRMCQLSEDARQRLGHLRLGPYSFKKETAPQPPFVVPRSPDSSLTESSTSPPAVRSSPRGSSFRHRSVSFAADLTDPELYGSFRTKPTEARRRSLDVPRVSPGASFGAPPHGKPPAVHSTPLSSSVGERSLREQSPVLSRSSLRERFHSPASPSPSQRIHSRVQRILRTHAARRLSFEDLSEEIGDSSQTNSQTQPDGVIPGEPSVHLDSGTFWTNKAAKYTGRSHRAVFEDSLGRIYRNMYRSASGPRHGESHSVGTS